MDVETTIQLLRARAPEHDARIALIRKASAALAEHQVIVQKEIERTQQNLDETRSYLRELGENTDRRIGALVSAIAKLVEHRPNGHATN